MIASILPQQQPQQQQQQQQPQQQQPPLQQASLETTGQRNMMELFSQILSLSTNSSLTPDVLRSLRSDLRHQLAEFPSRDPEQISAFLIEQISTLVDEETLPSVFHPFLVFLSLSLSLIQLLTLEGMACKECKGESARWLPADSNRVGCP